jgi:hypothetical protein
MAASPVKGDILLHSCAILKPLHYHLVSNSNTDRSTLHTVLQRDGHRLNTFPEEVRRNNSESISNFFSSRQVALVLIGRLSLGLTPHKEITCSMISTSRRASLFFLHAQSTEHENISQATQNRTRKMWLCSMLYEVQV